jgi:hypothetical protein
MPIDKKEFQSIQILQEELIELSNIESNMKAIDGRNPVQKLTDFYAVKSALYTDPQKLKDMIASLETVLKKYLESANVKGRILAGKQLDRYLDASEARDISQSQLRKITLESNSASKARLKLSLMELRKEQGILSSDIAIFKAESKLAGLTDKEALKQILIAGKDRTGIVQGFAKRIKQINVEAVRREKSASEIFQYEKQAKPNEKWQWLTISVKPCPDCEARAGKVMLLKEWQRLGFPGAGRTICGRACKCQIIPLAISEDLFPTIKVFDWDPKNQVLTTASEARQLNAKKNKPPQRTKK